MIGLTIIGLGLVGLLVGTQVNRAIYDWAWFVERSPSPYSWRPHLRPATAWDYLPVVGWWFRRDLAGQTLYPTALERAEPHIKKSIPCLGRWYYLRPMLVELGFGLGLPALAWYYQSGTWLGGVSTALIPGGDITLWIWLGFHAVLLALMSVAALIDWDEKTIPDQVTTTGIVLALLVYWVWPLGRLPEIEYSGLRVASVSPLHFYSPQFIPVAGELTEPAGVVLPASWSGTGFVPHGLIGLSATLLAWTCWFLLVIPSICTLRFGWRKGLWLAWASVRRPPRRRAAVPVQPVATTGTEAGTVTATVAGGASRPRRIHPVTWISLAVWMLAVLICVATWTGGGLRWEAIFSLSCSLGLAGLGTWLVRILATMVMGMEALGFGDVTLMFMIGAAFGWQFALMVFALAPLLAIGFALFQFILRRENALAFGPWLCLAAALLLIFWQPVWHDFASRQVFVLGPLLLLILGACLILLPVILYLVLTLKRLVGLG